MIVLLFIIFNTNRFMFLTNFYYTLLKYSGMANCKEVIATCMGKNTNIIYKAKIIRKTDETSFYTYSPHIEWTARAGC